MSKQRRVRKDRVFLLIIAAIVLVCLIGVAIFFLMDEPEKPVDPVKPDVPGDVTKKTVSTELLDYEVYEDKEGELGFDFVLAKIRFKAEESAEFDLKDLETSQKVNLSDTEKYTKKLTEKKYSLEDKSVSKKINTINKEADAWVFVPVTKKEGSIVLYNKQDGYGMSIDLTKNIKELSSLKKESDGNVVDDKGRYDIRISDSFVSTMMMKNGEDYAFPSDSTVYTFKLKINEAEEGIRILDAEFVQTSTGNTYKALDSSYESRKLDNIIGRNLAEVDDSMALFFEVYEEGGSHDYTGTLRLSFSGSEGWKEFSTELR